MKIRRESLLLLAVVNLVLAVVLVKAYAPIVKNPSARPPRQTTGSKIESEKNPESAFRHSPNPTATPIAVGAPVKLAIPRLKITAEVVPVGITPANTMEVPKDASLVGWYQPGSKPGQWGAAIFTGHYDTPSGKPAIFYQLRFLKPGDEIIVWTERGEEFVFQVYSVESEPADIPPSRLAYGNFTGKELRLVTCDGIWDRKEKAYSKRLVVFAQL